MIGLSIACLFASSPLVLLAALARRRTIRVREMAKEAESLPTYGVIC